MSASTSSQNLLCLCRGGDKNAAEISSLLAAAPDLATYQDNETGTSVLMAAAEAGASKVCSLLLEVGAPWNALDRNGRCAGEYAVDAGHQDIVDLLVTAGVTAELLLGAVDRNNARRMKMVEMHSDSTTSPTTADTSCGKASQSERGNDEVDSKDSYDAHFPARPGMYLEDRGVRYDGNKLLDSADDAVMMEWETPLMEAHADILMAQNMDIFGEMLVPLGMQHASCQPSGTGESSVSSGLEAASGGRSVLNVGFGMGIIDGALQKRMQQHPGCRHTIIEAHPAVYEKMLQDGWGSKEGVTILFGRWQDVLKLPDHQNPDAADATVANSSEKKSAAAKWDGRPFDGVFFDTYGERYSDMEDFHNMLPCLVKPGGVYSFFNGMCPFNIFFQGVACELVKTELAALGFRIIFIPLQIDLDKSAWDGVTRKYWIGDTYYLPVAARSDEDLRGVGCVGKEDKSTSSGKKRKAAEST